MSQDRHNLALPAPRTSNPVAFMTATAIGLSLALGASAQAAPPAQPPSAASAPSMRGEMGARHEQHAARLRAILQLRPDQEPALSSFMDAMAQLMTRKGSQEGVQQDASTTPRRLDAQRARLQARLSAFDAYAEATRRFYGQLTPAQQRAFDALYPMMGGGWHRRGPGPAKGHAMAPHGHGPGMVMGAQEAGAHDH